MVPRPRRQPGRGRRAQGGASRQPEHRAAAEQKRSHGAWDDRDVPSTFALVRMSAAHEGLRVGLVVTATGLGFRHGLDWDHLAAITDLTAAQDTPRRAFGYASCYFVGHGAVLGALGGAAIGAGEHVPAPVDRVMERIVGLTLCALGVSVLVAWARGGRDFRMRSRWMLVFSAVRRLVARLRPVAVSLATVTGP